MISRDIQDGEDSKNPERLETKLVLALHRRARRGNPLVTVPVLRSKEGRRLRRDVEKENVGQLGKEVGGWGSKLFATCEKVITTIWREFEGSGKAFIP